MTRGLLFGRKNINKQLCVKALTSRQYQRTAPILFGGQYLKRDFP